VITTRRQVNGVDLHIEILGSGSPLVLLHGFTGSAASWKKHSAVFSYQHRVIAVDALGHGLSVAPTGPHRYAMSQVAADLVALFDQLDIKQAALLGYSMGGRMALYFALTFPHRISKLILESGSPGLKTAPERLARQQSDNALADRIEREGVPAFVEYWEELPLWQSQAQLPAATRLAQREQRLHNSALGLANSLRGVGTGAQESLWERLPTLSLPTLLIVGELDQKFQGVARQMQEKIPRTQLAVISGAGHTVHLERPQEFDILVSNFID